MERRRETDGRYALEHACHACGKPAPMDNYYTDDLTCADGGDGPGFILCGRKRCIDKREAMTLEQRLAYYNCTISRMRDVRKSGGIS